MLVKPMLSCVMEGCERELVDKGMCAECLAAYTADPKTNSPVRKRVGRPKVVKASKVICSATSCRSKAHTRGLCRKHYDRQSRLKLAAFRPTRKNFTGAVVGELTVVEMLPNGSWNCLCTCGRTLVRQHGKLLRAVAEGTHSNCGVCCSGDLEEGIARRTHNGYKIAAIKRGLAFELSKEDFAKIIFSPCLYCGETRDKVHRGKFFGGVDRVNNELGYVPHNCVPCCTTCNMAKRAMTPVKWETWLAQMVAFRSKESA